MHRPLLPAHSPSYGQNRYVSKKVGHATLVPVSPSPESFKVSYALELQSKSQPHPVCSPALCHFCLHYQIDINQGSNFAVKTCCGADHRMEALKESLETWLSAEATD